MIEKLIDLIPPQFKMYAMIAASLVIIGALGFIYYKIDKRGYDRCETAHAIAAQKLKDQSRKIIIKVQKTHEVTKSKIINQIGPNDPVGPRVTLAIDGLPVPSDSR